MNKKDQFESLACNCVEVGTLIREDDTVLTIDLSGVDAESRFAALKEEAAKIGSGNCKISAETVDEHGQTAIRAMFQFDCTAEKLIFQMRNA
ncbi:YfcZ/YiiS family protein [Endozoicomonas sp. ONNA2]|uniref:YfcZ/YiiS family protein n=1 Tax=Endozoicomonas sp. ONNA2 TaxID=2828741 RepID=UPI00214958E7|nr:YfcZ/YiiS family protein [Endozoicomonas sp. ONNA2]